MRYYKVLYNRRVIDLLTELKYVKLQLKHNILLSCDESEACGVLSSTGKTAYHTRALLPFPVDSYLTVTLEEITRTEYDHLKVLHLLTPDEIIDNYTQELLERGLL